MIKPITCPVCEMDIDRIDVFIKIHEIDWNVDTNKDWQIESVEKELMLRCPKCGNDIDVNWRRIPSMIRREIIKSAKSVC